MEDVLKQIEEVVEQGPYAANWESLKSYTIPKWYEDAKFGIFIHWGVYAVPAFGSEWYPRQMYLQGSKEFEHHVATYGPQAEFGYKDFIPLFKAENYDPAAWAELFRKSGAKFIMPVAEHHDGFPMYDTSLSEWNAAKIGPKRDLIGDLADAVRNEGMVFCVSSHRAEHYWFFDGGRKFDSDVNDPRFDGLYGPAKPEPKAETDEWPDAEFLDDWLARTCELVDKYQPQVVWFDWWIENAPFKPYLQKFAAYYYNRGVEWGKGVAINYKNNAYPEGTAVWDIERGQLAEIRSYFWQTDTAVSKNSWGYIEGQDYKTVDSLIDDLVDIVSKNGALLLNIGPRPDGTIPEPEVEMLLEIGKWLEMNGEAIYGTRPWKIYGEGPTEVVGGSFNDTKREPFTGQDLRFTSKGDTLYAIALAWSGEQLVIQSLGASSEHAPGNVTAVSLLGHDGDLEWSQGEDGLTIRLPATPPGDHAFAFRISGQ